MAEGGTYASLRQRYIAALSSGENNLRALLGSASSSWKPIQTVQAPVSGPTEDAADLSKTEDPKASVSGIDKGISSIISVHKRRVKGAPDVARATCNVSIANATNSLESLRAVLSTQGIRHEWDHSVEKQEPLEVVEPSITLCRTYTKIGWPSNARDMVTIDKILHDPGKTLIYLSVSLPRSASKGGDDPPFLQPSPPYVRSHLHICAFVATCSGPNRMKLSMYWQWDLKGSGVIWTNHISLAPRIMSSLVDYTMQRSLHVPYVRSWGNGVALDAMHFDSFQDRLEVSYGIFNEDPLEKHDDNQVLLERSKERRRLERSLEIKVPPAETSGGGWDITVHPPASTDSGDVQWQISAEKDKGSKSEVSRTIVRLTHSSSKDGFQAITVALQRLAGGKVLKVNGDLVPLTSVEERDPTAFTARLNSTPSSPGVNMRSSSMLPVDTTSDAATYASATTSTTTPTPAQVTPGSRTQRVLSEYINRAYSHFLSLLQAPDAKWRSVSDVRRVSVSSYAAIDPTSMPIYKYETSIVNTTIWDILAVLTSNGSRHVWDKHSGLERLEFLQEIQLDQGHATGMQETGPPAAAEGRVSFWEAKWRAVWPTAPREAVYLRTTYRSPTSIHLLQTTVPEDDADLWRIFADKLSPSTEGTIRLQSRLQSVAIDQISPTTTSVTLVEQTNPKSWTKSGYTAMATAVANLGEFALKEGAPPLITYLSGGSLKACTYDHEAGGIAKFAMTSQCSEGQTMECVIRMDFDVWASGGASLSIAPKPDRISAVSRHRLSQKGSGCWVSLEFKSAAGASSADAPTEITVQRLSESSLSQQSQDRHKLLVNGERVAVEIEALAEAEIHERRLQRRMKSRAIMLDGTSTPRSSTHFGRPPSVMDFGEADSKPNTPSSSVVLTQGQAPRPPSISADKTTRPDAPLPDTPVSYALIALARARFLHKNIAAESLWTVLSYMENNSPIQISRATVRNIHPTLPVFRIERTFPNVTDDQVMRILQSSSSNVRTAWDERLASIETIASYESGMTSSLWIAKPSFPTRSRVMYMASICASEVAHSNDQAGAAPRKRSYLASMSMPLSSFEAELVNESAVIATDRLNPSKSYNGAIPLECWILETTKQTDEEDEALSRFFTRCTLYTCSDMPLMTPGTFGNANIRTRLARIFDLLESASRADSLMLGVRYPPPFVAVSDDLPAFVPPSQSLLVSVAKRGATLMAFTSNTATIAFSLSENLEGASIVNPNPQARSPVGGNTSGPDLRRHDLAQKTPSQVDSLIAEIVLCRDAATIGYEIRSTTTTLDSLGKSLPTDTSFWSSVQAIPWSATISAMSTPSRGAMRHALRINLPIRHGSLHLQDPLSDEVKETSMPRWYRKLKSGIGVVHLQILPVKTDQPFSGRPALPLKCTFDGQSLVVQTPAEGFDKGGGSSTGATDFERLDEIRDSASDHMKSRRMFRLASPSIVNTAFLKHAPSRHRGLEIGATSPQATSSPANGDPVKGVLETAKTDMVPPGSPEIAKVKQPIVDLFTTTTVIQKGAAGAPGSRTISERTYRISFVILVAVISFLLGSLLRSLLSPGDYVLFPRKFDSMETAIWDVFNEDKKWKFATRLVELPVPGTKRDFIAALVERK